MTTFTLLGTVSHGTLRYQDLIPAFLDVLTRLDAEKADKIRGGIPTEAFEDDNHEFWLSEEASYILNEDLFDELNNHAPDFVYFGAIEGDGADFGFWMDYDGIREALRNNEAIISEEPPTAPPEDEVNIVFVGANEYDITSMWKWDGDAWHEVWGT